MSKVLTISLTLFSIMWIIIILYCIRSGKISVKYSLIWFLMTIVLLFVGIFPNFMEIIAKFLGFTTISNLVIGIILTLLMFITLVLTIILTKQKLQIKNLIQEISMLKKDEK